LPNDDSHAVLYRLRVQYGNDDSTSNISPRTIGDIETFAGKYALVQRFKPISYMWLEVALGDNVLVVGAERIRISIDPGFLQHVSPLFEAMLRAGIQESNEVRNAICEVPKL
jgi:hypothetical protein